MEALLCFRLQLLASEEQNKGKNFFPMINYWNLIPISAQTSNSRARISLSMPGQCPALSEVQKTEQQQEKEKGSNSRPHLFSVSLHHLALDVSSVAVIGCTPCPKQLATSKPITEGSQGRSMKAGAGTKTMKEHCLLPLARWATYAAQAPSA